jgi:hypothetical protein
MEEILFPRKECSFGQIILRRDALQGLVRQPRFERANTGWISTKGPGTESIDVIIGDLHE